MSAKTASARTAKRPAKPTASEIAPGVFVGGWKDAVNFEGTRICVLDEDPGEEVPGGTRVPIYDPSADRPIRANLEKIAGLAKASEARHEPVLFYCGHGVRRGPLAAAWYLHERDGIPLAAAYDRIRAVRPKIETADQWAGDVSVLGT